METTAKSRQQTTEAKGQCQLAFLYEQATAAFNANKIAEAIDWFDLLLALDPNYKDASDRRAEAEDKLASEREELNRLCANLNDEQRRRAIELIKQIIKDTTPRDEPPAWLRPLIEVFIIGVLMSFCTNILAQLLTESYPAISLWLAAFIAIVIGTFAAVTFRKL